MGKYGSAAVNQNEPDGTRAVERLEGRRMKQAREHRSDALCGLRKDSTETFKR
jgi:hypothetical protein